nr:PREDICTED: formin-like protein 14 isoform X1 [Lepisosteus oculatus]
MEHARRRGGRGSPLRAPSFHQRICSREDTPTRRPDAPKEGATLLKSQVRLPLIPSGTGRTGGKEAGRRVSLPEPKTAPRPPLPQRHTLARRRKHAPPTPPPPVSSDTMAPWGGLSLSDSSFAAIATPPAPPPLPPAPPPRVEGRTRVRGTVPPPGQDPGKGPSAGGRAHRKTPVHRKTPRAARLPPLRAITALSFSRSFTFSFFELPEHQSLRGRAERQRGVYLLLRQIHHCHDTGLRHTDPPLQRHWTETH